MKASLVVLVALTSAAAACRSTSGAAREGSPVVSSRASNEAITTEDRYARFAQDYYRDPRPDLVESAMRFVAASELLKKPETAVVVRMSFSCIFARHPERRAAWKTAIASLEAGPRESFSACMDSTPEQLLDLVPVSPERNDGNWACFLVSGDPRYARNVVEAMRYLGERKDLQKYLAAASGQWSLASLSQKHDRVREVLVLAAQGGDATVAAGARDALSKPAETFVQAMQETLRQQHAAGVW